MYTPNVQKTPRFLSEVEEQKKSKSERIGYDKKYTWPNETHLKMFNFFINSSYKDQGMNLNLFEFYWIRPIPDNAGWISIPKELCFLIYLPYYTPDQVRQFYLHLWPSAIGNWKSTTSVLNPLFNKYPRNSPKPFFKNFV